MLKVVGASWYKTRISTYILAGAFMLAFGAFFIADMERPVYNGTYCATAYWARNSGFRVEFWGQRNDLEAVPMGAVRACYKDSLMESGWSQLELESQPEYPDNIQAFAAGMLEGALSWHNIYLHWTNTINAECTRDEQSEEFCDWLRRVITTNVETVKKMADMKSKHDHYWYQIGLFYDQIDGLEFGFRKGVRRSRLEYDIPAEDFLLMNSAIDIRDLKSYYLNFLDGESGLEVEPNKGMMLLRILESSSGLVKILLGHTSDGSYASMLRMIKKYTLNYHFSEDSNIERVVPSTNIVFTSYPAVLASLDDFYMLSGRKHKMVTAGIKIENDNLNLWTKIDLVRSVSLAPRVMAANRLAHSGRVWAKYFARSPSTGAKQWLILDMKRLDRRIDVSDEYAETDEQLMNNANVDKSDSEEQPTESRILDDYVDVDFEENTRRITSIGKISEGGLFWVVDQLPGRLHAEDMTEKIIKDGYWLGNGVPIFKELADIGHVKTNSTNTQQHSIQEKILNNITDLDGLAKYIRQSAYRGDLDQQNPTAFGNIDMKLFVETNASNGTFAFQAYSGPLYDPISDGQAAKRSVESTGTDDKENDVAARPIVHGSKNKRIKPFDWNAADQLEARHQGQPNVWNFGRQSPQWAWV
ncbi:putative phospholipase B-like lamina ancestor [Toxorhynchites rutilus septentrionalis]|uniref:putative phospholipase B-like lamina ancestor n=1 Tax=Toxorhynchites rutilus septentrionalis TaxID=329112 RepID=UPI002479C0DE|nr:putative phospholipase B-like lamina ancestor [Toxorhynchites rutilus septentrionalis]XP_055627940.1 putative phospholipase B-like lamina ancestor [Toxorhynchites rutilus septentrionalis]XP_055627941.1 putative phospholipase B-like lamina ancestor [Toxorhynchites rutilus septentrionalis]XP_055627942.1 putative phospholipase B-like lamina ancestor [Toxorhynchites rutilus septentrionalis]